ncbi:MAG: glycosyltransferase [Clostridia bacterium]|nr:glycosyltransferase [Clostridia bacterium]
MKVMQINCVYRSGSTGKIVFDIHTALKEKGIESLVCYGRGNDFCEDKVFRTSGELEGKLNNLISRINGVSYGGCFFATNRLIDRIKKEKPDVVHLHCINGFFVNIYRLVRYLKKHRIPTIITHHAEFFYTANCSYAFDCEKWMTGCGNCPSVKKAVHSYFFDFTKANFGRMKKAFAGFENMISAAVSPWVQKRAEMSPIFADKKNVSVLNGIDCSVFAPCGDREKLKAELGILPDKKAIVHVTADFDDPRKGGRYVREFAEKMGNEAVVVVVGNRRPPENLPNNIIAVGRVENQRKLAEYYSMADLCLIASSRETFSMPVAESLCCGTPVVGFEAGGPESIAISEFSEFVEYGNVEKLCEAAHKILVCDIDRKKAAEAAAGKYGKQTMVNEYIGLYNEVLGINATQN